MPFLIFFCVKFGATRGQFWGKSDLGLRKWICTFVDAGEAPAGSAQDAAPSARIFLRMPRYINDIIIHCTATPSGRDYTLEQIEAWHKQRGYSRIGYHYIIHLDGSVERGRPISQPGAHCYGHNAHSIGVCYVGGIDDQGNPSDTRTPAQKDSLLQLTARLVKMYRCRPHGHNEYAAKDCPCFDVHNEFGSLYCHICQPKG